MRKLTFTTEHQKGILCESMTNNSPEVLRHYSEIIWRGWSASIAPRGEFNKYFSAVLTSLLHKDGYGLGKHNVIQYKLMDFFQMANSCIIMWFQIMFLIMI